MININTFIAINTTIKIDGEIQKKEKKKKER